MWSEDGIDGGAYVVKAEESALRFRLASEETVALLVPGILSRRLSYFSRHLLHSSLIIHCPV